MNPIRAENKRRQRKTPRRLLRRKVFIKVVQLSKGLFLVFYGKVQLLSARVQRLSAKLRLQSVGMQLNQVTKKKNIFFKEVRRAQWEDTMKQKVALLMSQKSLLKLKKPAKLFQGSEKQEDIQKGIQEFSQLLGSVLTPAVVQALEKGEYSEKDLNNLLTKRMMESQDLCETIESPVIHEKQEDDAKKDSQNTNNFAPSNPKQKCQTCADAQKKT